MASFLIMVHSGRYASQSSRSALRFSKAAINAGHQVKAVFFYSEGISHANALSVIPRDELDSGLGFKALHSDHQVPLLLCVTAAEKRGVLDKTQAEQESLPHHNFDSSYTIAGLAEMAAITAEVDRVVQFK